jgi:hypothetical protein
VTTTAENATAASSGGETPAARVGTVLDRVFSSPWGFVVTLVVITTFGLGADHFATRTQQNLLGLCDTILFLFVLRYFTPMERVTALVVVAVATWSEFVGSVLWGLYVYRLDNLPLFIPAGHGLVFLTGLRLSQTRWAREHRTKFMTVTFLFAAGWALLGLTGWLGRVDAAGAFGVLVVSLAMRYGPNPTVYAGVFWFVAYLEIYGTAIGTWRWAELVPGTPIPDGNPPSGAASGYVAFDVTAYFLAPPILNGFYALRRRFR